MRRPERRAGGRLPALALVVVVVCAGAVAEPVTAQTEPAVVADAVKRGDLAAAARLAGEGGVDTPDASGAAALHWAAHRGDAAAVSLLLRAGANPDGLTRYGVTPLALGCVGGHVSVVEALLDAGADANLASPEGETPLMAAARTGVAASVLALLDHGADPNAREGWRGQTALMWAAAENHAAVVGPLVTGGAEVDARSDAGFTPLLFAVRAGHLSAVEALIEAGADIALPLPDGTSPLVVSIINAHYDLAVRLLEQGADATAAEQGWTALHQVVWTRRPNRHYNNPAAIPSGTVTDLELVRTLVAHGADVNARQTAEPRDRYRNALNRIGATPFLLAAKSVDLALMRLLLELGADPLLANADGTTPLLVAAGVGIWSASESPGSAEEALDAVMLMIELGDAVTTVDANGDAALHGAVMRDSEPLVRFLIDRGAAVNPVNDKGWTPLTITQDVFYANLGRRFPRMEAVLLEYGATSPLTPAEPR